MEGRTECVCSRCCEVRSVRRRVGDLWTLSPFFRAHNYHAGSCVRYALCGSGQHRHMTYMTIRPRWYLGVWPVARVESVRLEVQASVASVTSSPPLKARIARVSNQHGFFIFGPIYKLVPSAGFVCSFSKQHREVQVWQAFSYPSPRPSHESAPQILCITESHPRVFPRCLSDVWVVEAQPPAHTYTYKSDCCVYRPLFVPSAHGVAVYLGRVGASCYEHLHAKLAQLV